MNQKSRYLFASKYFAMGILHINMQGGTGVKSVEEDEVTSLFLREDICTVIQAFTVLGVLRFLFNL